MNIYEYNMENVLGAFSPTKTGYLLGLDVFGLGAVGRDVGVVVGAGQEAVQGVSDRINSKVDVVCHSQLRCVSEGVLHSFQGFCTTAGRQNAGAGRSSWAAAKLDFPELLQEFVAGPQRRLQTPEVFLESGHRCASDRHPKDPSCHPSREGILEKVATGAPGLTGKKLSVSHLQRINHYQNKK